MEARLKIALVRPFFTTAMGGAERYAVELAQALSARGHEVHVFASAWEKPEPSGISYHRVPAARKPAWLRVITFHYRLGRVLNRSDYDAVLGMAPFLPQGIFWLGDGLYRVWTRARWPGAAWRWLMCLRRAVMIVNLFFERRLLGGGAVEFLANSNLVRKQAVREYGVPEERVALVYPGVDLSRFHPGVRAVWREPVRRALGIAQEEIVFLFVANNFRRKGLDLVFSALRKLNGQARLVVVGSGRKWLFERMASWLGIRNRVLFIGGARELEKYYGAADVLVLPTRYDPFAAVCLEAMACGLPVITSAMNGAAELIEQESSGMVVARPGRRRMRDHLRDPKRLLRRPFLLPAPARSLRRAMEFFLDRERRAAAGERAARRARDFSQEEHLRQVIAVLQSHAAKRNGKLKIARPEPELVMNRDFVPLLEARGLGRYGALAEARGAARLEYNRGKEIYVFRLADGGRPASFYLKRYRSRLSWPEKIRARLGAKLVYEGMGEWDNIVALIERGVPAVTPVAAGGRLLPNGVKESFVVTLGLDGYAPLDEHIGARFAAPLDSARLREKRRVIAAAARLTRALHWSGFNHRDFYLCHLFARPSADGVGDLRIIDAQRIGYRMFPRARWRIKDLAALHYSSLERPLTKWDRLRFYAIYSRRTPRLARRFELMWLLRKARAIARHDESRRESPRANNR
ncbi:MAG TPA: glycosyltransferase [Candidatus Acidoferrales bacterium]|nr:glycosyltransferase [Candidatus Acidoferrales bacterium]